jgi:hypothetical protein
MDGGFYDLLSAPDDAVAQERAKALQAVLRRNQDASSLAALSGAKTLQPFAQMTGGAARQQESLLASAGGNRLKMAMEASQAKQAQANADRTFGLHESNAQESVRHNRAMEGLVRTKAAAGGHIGGLGDGDAEAIADAIERGDQPPTLTPFRSAAAPVAASLAKRGFDLTTATRDWQAISRHMSSLNSTQQLRLRQAVDFTHESLDVIDGLYDEWLKAGPASGFKMLNRAALAAAKQGGGKAGEVAHALEAQINDLVSELGTVYKGGNASTDESLRLAAENLKGDWNEGTFRKAMGLVRKNLALRRNSIANSSPQGVSEGSLYNDRPDPHAAVTPQTGVPTEPGGAPVAPASSADGMIRVKRKDTGKTGKMPASKFNPELYEKIG